ncbi:hypothetical protein GGR55DRAFT_336998 [Xylaria sp. FL0064]|nr:hypothetical protein GGR55DRAFT_336998 [Xylaria sp. FL0064]
MRSHTLVAVVAAAGTLAVANTQVTRQKRQAPGSIVKWASPDLATRSNLGLHRLLTRRAILQTVGRNRSRRVSRRTRASKRDDDDDDDDGGGDDDGDTDDGDDEDSYTDTDDSDDGDDSDKEEDNDNKSPPSHAGAIAGGIIGGLFLLFLLLFIPFWFKIRPRRQRRRRRREEDEEKRRRKRREEEEQGQGAGNQSYPLGYHPYQQPYRPVPTYEPPRDRGVSAAAAPKGSASPSSQPPQPPVTTAAFPAELQSPVDGHEPTSLPSKLQADHPSSVNRVSPPRYSTLHPADQANPTY